MRNRNKVLMSPHSIISLNKRICALEAQLELLILSTKKLELPGMDLEKIMAGSTRTCQDHGKLS